jgi:hypothetical protein
VPAASSPGLVIQQPEIPPAASRLSLDGGNILFFSSQGVMRVGPESGKSFLIKRHADADGVQIVPETGT